LRWNVGGGVALKCKYEFKLIGICGKLKELLDSVKVYVSSGYSGDIKL
jgi:hypothetical protein